MGTGEDVVENVILWIGGLAGIAKVAEWIRTLLQS